MLETAVITSIIGALLPTVTDAFGAIINRLTGGAGALPKNVDEVIKLQAADVERLRALADLDKPTGDVSRWVADLRASFRPIIACAAFSVGVATLFVRDVPMEVANNIFALASMVTSYMFGERFLFGSRGYGKNK
jgi:hypothetical protein